MCGWFDDDPVTIPITLVMLIFWSVWEMTLRSSRLIHDTRIIRHNPMSYCEHDIECNKRTLSPDLMLSSSIFILNVSSCFRSTLIKSQDLFFHRINLIPTHTNYGNQMCDCTVIVMITLKLKTHTWIFFDLTQDMLIPSCTSTQKTSTHYIWTWPVIMSFIFTSL